MRPIPSVLSTTGLAVLVSLSGCVLSLDGSAPPPIEDLEPGPPMFAALGPGDDGVGAAVIIMDADGDVIRRLPTGNSSSPWEEWSMSWHPDKGVFLVSENSNVLWSVQASTGEVVEYGSAELVLNGLSRNAGLPDGGVLIVQGDRLYQTNADEELVQTWESEDAGVTWSDVVAHESAGMILLASDGGVRVFVTDERLGGFDGFVDSMGQDGGGAIWGASTSGGPVGWFTPGGETMSLGEPSELGLLRKAMSFEPLPEEDAVWVLSADGYAEDEPNSRLSVLTRSGDVTDLFETDEWWLDFAVVSGLLLDEASP